MKPIKCKDCLYCDKDKCTIYDKAIYQGFIDCYNFEWNLSKKSELLKEA